MKGIRMSSAIVMIVLGTLFIALGGITATLGWSKRADDKRREGAVNQIAAELMVNHNILADPDFQESDPEKLKTFVVLPRFQTISLDAAISSGVFLDAKHRELLTRVTSLSEILKDANNRLNLTESQMLSLSEKDRAQWRMRLRDGKTLESVAKQLKELAKLLTKSYGVDESRKFFVELDGAAAELSR